MTTTVKIKFRPSTVVGRLGTIVYLVTHRRIVRQITTDYKLYPHEWDESKSTVIAINNENISNERKEVITFVDMKLRHDMDSLKMVIQNLDSKKIAYTSDNVVTAFHELMRTHSFKSFMENTIFRLKRLGKERTSETYTSTLASFIRFRKGRDLLFEEMTSDLMMEYEAWLKSNGVRRNTVSFYNRILRAVYNRAVEQELTSQRYPFKHVYTGIDKTVKRAIPLKDIKRIKELDLSLRPSLDFARDLFMFSFYTRGMSFVDMAYLKKTDLRDGILTYVRRKTKQTLLVKWEKCMQKILDKHPTGDSEYILPIIRDRNNERRQYRNMLRLVNNNLKKISTLAGLHTNLTMYVSRHSWARAAKDQNIPLSVISEGMGHDSENTTLIYLTSLDTSRVDMANELILGKL